MILTKKNTLKTVASITIVLLSLTQHSAFATESSTKMSGSTCPKLTGGEDPNSVSEPCTVELLKTMNDFMLYFSIGGELKSSVKVKGNQTITTTSFKVNPLTMDKLLKYVNETWVTNPDYPNFVTLETDLALSSVTIRSSIYKNVSTKLSLDNYGLLSIDGKEVSTEAITVENTDSSSGTGSPSWVAKCDADYLKYIDSMPQTIDEKLVTKKCLQNVAVFVAESFINMPFTVNDPFTLKDPKKPITYTNIIPNYGKLNYFGSEFSFMIFKSKTGPQYEKYYTYSLKGDVFTVTSKKYPSVKAVLKFSKGKYYLNNKALTILDLAKFFKIIEMPNRYTQG